MSGWLWFIAGFVSCLLVSLLSVSFLVWKTPPAREEAKDEMPSNSHEPTHSRPSVVSVVRRQTRRLGG